MGGLSAGSDAFFSVSPATLTKPESFAVRRGDNLERLDVRFNHPAYGLWGGRLAAAPGETPELGILLRSIASGATPKRSDESLYAAEGIRFFRILNVGDGEILERDLKYITEEVHNGDLERSQLESGDVLLTITGRVGSAAVVQSEHLPANINQHIARLRVDREQCRPEFLREWLNCPAGLALSNRPVSGGTRPALDYSAVRNIRVPLPDLTEQDRLVATMEAARVERSKKLAAADELLAGLDDFVLGALGLNPNPPQRATAAIRVSNLRGSRYDPDFHSLRFKTIREGIASGAYPTASIAELCEQIVTGFAAGRGNQAFDYESGLPHLRPLNLDTFGQLSLAGTKFVPKEAAADDNLCQWGEVLFNNTNSTSIVGKSVVFELAQPCACSNHITRLRPRNGVSPHYLAAVFNSLRRLGYLGLLSTNFNNQAGINRETLSQLRIPHPPLPEQERIAAEVIRRREESRRLRSAAEAGWQAAKEWFEGEVLGK